MSENKSESAVPEGDGTVDTNAGDDAIQGTVANAPVADDVFPDADDNTDEAQPKQTKDDGDN